MDSEPVYGKKIFEYPLAQDLPPDTSTADLVRLAKVRWRIEHDYRKLKHGLGLDHFVGRSWPGRHHHITLVTAAHAFLTEQRLAPNQHHPLPDPRCPPRHPEVLDRDLYELPATPPHQSPHNNKIKKDLTESY
jgi:SRSO17 transposase